jgi:diguanylate cyclase
MKKMAKTKSAIPENEKTIRRLIRGFIIVALVMVSVGIVKYYSLKTMEAAYEDLATTHQIVSRTNELQVAMFAIVSGEQGYLLTGFNSYLDLVRDGIQNFTEYHADLVLLTKNDSHHQRRLELIQSSYQSLSNDLINPLIEYRSLMGSEIQISDIMDRFGAASRMGKYYMDEILRLLDSIEQIEIDLLQIRQEKLGFAMSVDHTINILGSIVILIILFVVGQIGIARLRKNQAENERYGAELTASRDSLANVIEATNVGTWEIHVPTGRMKINERWAGILGYSLKELVPADMKTWSNLVHPDDLQEAEKVIGSLFVKEIEFFEMDIRMRHNDGFWVWIHDRGKVISWTSDGKPLLMTGTHTDISARMKLQDMLHLEKEWFKTTLLSVADGVISTDVQGNVLVMNKVAQQLTGWNDSDAVGKRFDEIFKVVCDSPGKEVKNLVMEVIETGEPAKADDSTILISRDGLDRYVESNAAPIMNAQGKVNGAVIVFRDSTEKKKRQEEMLHLSYRDPLTGLYNRRYYDEQLQLLDGIDYYPLTLILADVNGLKLTNDAFGHDTGDLLLKLVAEVLASESRQDDIAARVGGDEFILMLPKTDAIHAAVIIERMNKALRKKSSYNLVASVSFGLAVKTETQREMAEVFREAEDAMYKQKLLESPKIKKYTIDLLLETLFTADEKERSHAQRVSKYCQSLAEGLNYGKEEVAAIQKAAFMHDIGKISISRDIWEKSARLNVFELSLIRRHAEIGYNILRSIHEYATIAEYVLYHHERWDGNGYPKGLKGEDIPIQSRIIAVADAFDAMVSSRHYREAMSKQEAVQQLKDNASKQFDYKITRYFVEHILQEIW